MIRYIKNELYRAFFNRNTFFAFIIGLLCLFIGGYEMLDVDGNIIDFIYTYLFAQSSGTLSLLAILFPTLVCLPYAASYVTEYQSGYINYIYSKSNRKTYIISKIISTGFVGGFVVGAPCFIYLMICLLRKGTVLSNESGYIVCFYRNLFLSHPVLYGLMLVVNSFICGIIFAIFGLGISPWIKNKYLSILFPLCYYLFSAIVLSDISNCFNAITLFSLNHYASPSKIGVLTYDLILLIVSILLFITGVIRNEE